MGQEMSDEILKIIASGGGISSGVVIYLVWSMRRELSKLTDVVSILTEKMSSTVTTQDYIMKEVDDLKNRIHEQEKRCYTRTGHKDE